VGGVVPTGNSTLLLRVLSEDTFVQQVYNIRLHRLSNDTSLLRLRLAALGSGALLVLSPAFEPGRSEYAATVSHSEGFVSAAVSACASYAPWMRVFLSISFLPGPEPELEAPCDGSQFVIVGPGEPTPVPEGPRGGRERRGGLRVASPNLSGFEPGL
jgi:hypothetical protein